MQGPTGLRGVHRVPNSGHSSLVIIPLSISPHLHPSGSMNSLSSTGAITSENLLLASCLSSPALIDKPLFGIVWNPRQDAL